MDGPLVLAVLGDRSFQNLILGILRRRIRQERGEFGTDMSELPSRHLNKLNEQSEMRGLKRETDLL